jgi:hypothetical protein
MIAGKKLLDENLKAFCLFGVLKARYLWSAGRPDVFNFLFILDNPIPSHESV